jgi:hypothetical protein
MIIYFYPAMAESLPLPGERTVGKYLRKCNEICEILTPRVFHAVRQDDNTFWRKRLNRTFIMRHKDYRTTEASQRGENLFPASGIEVVGRFVEK